MTRERVRVLWGNAAGQLRYNKKKNQDSLYVYVR